MPCESIRSRLTVPLGERSYEIHIGPGLLSELGRVVAEKGLKGQAFVVSDSNVDSLYGERAENSLAGAGYSVTRCVVPAGEASKNVQQLVRLYDAALSAGLDREGFVVALGGGVVGDLAGFFAATYLRGVAYVQVPTTLLAMVDSSVGGKTGINLPQGKNLVGAFHQPALVLADVSTLATLPERERIAGLAEVIKYGAIRDAPFFERLEKLRGAPASSDVAQWCEIVRRCCEIKADIVAQDEREKGLRAILNFGHTLGHAIEQVTGYERFLHGEAVALGMVFAARLSRRCAGLPSADMERIIEVVGRMGLPTRRPDLDWRSVQEALRVDKKARRARPRWVLLPSLGNARPGYDVPDEVLAEVWNEG